MEETRVSQNRRKSFCILIGLLLFFLGMFAVYGLGVYNDSEQYISMHIHREPLYPLFLAFFRMMAGENTGLLAAAVVQNILAAVSIFVVVEYLQRKFSLNLFEELVLIAIELMPHLITRYVSALGIFLENSIMSEALCIPLFHFYLYFMLRFILDNQKKDCGFSLVFAFLLSMTRGQMMTTILIWLVVVFLKLWLAKQYKKLVIPILLVAGIFLLRSLSVHTYNYFVTGYFMGNTYGQVNTLTNVIYACDKEDGEVFEQGSQARIFFDCFYEQADELRYNYKYAGDTIKEQTEYLEACHDSLKYQVLEANMSAHYFGLGQVDYYMQSRMSDEMAGEMLKKLLPECFGRWFYQYLLLCRYGFIRSIAVVHPLINWAALGIYLIGAAAALYQLCKQKKSMAAVVMGLAFLFIAANVCATSLTIMCLSRYMIYGFSLFYMAFFLLFTEWMRNRKYEANEE